VSPLRLALGIALLGAAATASCGAPGGSQAGLSNAPAITRAPSDDDLAEDSVANGRGSCAQTPEGKDPLPQRLVPCPKPVEKPGKLKPIGSAQPAPSRP
jgi:hypothetical protein